MSESRNIVGAHLVVLINGHVIGEVTGFNFTSMTPHADIVGLDQLSPFELAPGGVKVSATMSVLRRQTAGGLEGRGITHHFSKIPEQRYFSVLVINRKDQTTFFRADDCMVQQQQWDIQARSRVSGSFSFTGLSWSNEVEVG